MEEDCRKAIQLDNNSVKVRILVHFNWTIWVFFRMIGGGFGLCKLVIMIVGRIWVFGTLDYR